MRSLLRVTVSKDLCNSRSVFFYLPRGMIPHAGDFHMKIVVAGIVGGLLLCASAGAGGYYVGKLTKLVSQTGVEKANADLKYFTRSLIEVRADMSDVLSSTDAFGNLKQIARRFRIASGRYLLALKSLPDSPMHATESKCLADADAAIDKMKLALMSVDSCEHAYLRTGRFCRAKERADASDYLSLKTDEVNETLNRCLGTLMDTPAATAAVSK